MKLLGLTGGIGAGKSTAAELLHRLGLPVVDTDQIARQLVEPGQPALEEIRLAFGAEVLDAGGQLRRDELARRVFADTAARQTLEKILHPPIRQNWLGQAESWRQEGVILGVVVIPLLYETGAASEFAHTICVGCSVGTQRQRLRARGWSEEQIDHRLQAQWPLARKMAMADFVVWTEASLEVHAAQLERILAAVR